MTHSDEGARPDTARDADTIYAPAVQVRVGPYADCVLHAKGGLGEVLRATDSHLHRVVAVKRLQTAFADDAGSQRRFRLEAEITARLEHPGVVPVYALVNDDASRPSYAMRFIEGKTFADAITEYHRGKPDPIEFRRLLQCLLQVCQTVAYAHSRGVLHRDLKPANVMLGKFGETLVVDWGLAKIVDRPDEIRETSAETTLQPTDSVVSEETALGAVVGTPSYMSPEQAAGRWDVVNTTSDVYSLGAILYTLLAGASPLSKGNWPELLQKIQRGDFPPPRRVKPDASPALEAICLKAMALDPERRYASAQALATEIELWLAGEPVTAWREPMRARYGRWMRRHQAFVTGAAVLLATALIAGAAGLFLLDRKNREIASERNAAVAAAEQAQSINAFLADDLLGQADPDVNDRSKKITVEEVLSRAASKIDGNPKFRGKPELEAELRTVIGKTFFKLGDLDQAEKHLKLAVALREQALGPDDPRTLAAQEALADFWNRGAERYADSVVLAERTWRARARVLGPEHPDTLDSLDTFGMSLLLLQRFDEAEARQRECLEGRQRVLGPDHPDTIVTMSNLALGLLDRGKWAEAKRILLEGLDRAGPRIHRTDLAMSKFNIVVAMYMMGELDEAERLLIENEASCVRQFGPEHPVTDRCQGIRVCVLTDLRRLEEAAKLGQKVVDRRKKIYAEDHRLTANAEIELGRALVLLGRPAEALGPLQSAWRLYAKSPPRSAYNVGWNQCWRGAALSGTGKRDEGVAMLVAAERVLRDRTDLPRRHYEECLEQLAKARRAAER